MEILFIFLSMFLLIYVSYRGLNIILFGTLITAGLILLAEPHALMPLLDVYMDKLTNFIKLYYLTFLLGAVFGKVMEISGCAQSISNMIMKYVGKERAILAFTLMGVVLTYGGVSAFVSVFALYPFGVQMFREADVPKRLLPAAIVFGSFAFSSSALPGSPQVQNIIPTSYFHTDTWAAPILGLCGSLFIFVFGLLYLERQLRRAKRNGEGYGKNSFNEPELRDQNSLPHPLIAFLPIVLVILLNRLLPGWISSMFGKHFDFTSLGIHDMAPIQIQSVSAIWSVEISLFFGSLLVVMLMYSNLKESLTKGLHDATIGTVSATMNTATQFGYGGIIQVLPGFGALQTGISHVFSNPLWNETVMANLFAGMTGSASGGLSIALATMGKTYMAQARVYGIPPEVLHRIGSVAGAGLDTLPHNGAILIILAICGMTHRDSYRDIFGITIVKVLGAIFMIAIYYGFRIV